LITREIITKNKLCSIAHLLFHPTTFHCTEVENPVEISTHLSILFIRRHPEDKLALGTLRVDDIVVHLLGLFHGIFLVDDRVHPA